MLKSYWARIVLFVVVGGLAALGLSFLIPKKYEAEVQIMVDQSLPSQPVTETAQQVSATDYLNFSRPRSIQTQQEQLGSLGVLTAASKKFADDHGQTDPSLDPNSELNPINLENEMSSTFDLNSDVIDFRLRMTDQGKVREIAQDIYLALVDQNEENSRKLAQQAIASLQAQSADISAQLKDIDAKSSALRQKSGFPDVGAAITAEVQALSLAKQARDTAAGDAAGAKQTVTVLTDELAKVPKVVSQSTTTATNPIWEKLQSDLFAAEADRQSLLATYLPGNSLVKAADQRIDSIKNALKQLKRDAPASANMGPNQTYQALEAQLATAKAAAQAAQQKLQVASSDVAAREQYLQTLPPIQTQLASLTRQQQALEKVYAGYQDQLKTLEAAKEGRSSPTREIGEPTLLPNAVSPKPMINGIFGAIVGLLLGIASMWFTEAKRQPIRSLASLNDLSFTPVYRLIPELRQPFRGLRKAPPEQYEALLVNYFRSAKRPYRIGVVGLHRDSGASTASLNLVLSASRHGSSALLVECDPKAPLARAGIKEALKPGDSAQLSSLVKVVASASVLGPSDHEPGLASALALQESDLTVIDLEPAVRSAEYAFVAPYVDEVILLVRAGHARSVEFLQAQQALIDAGCKKMTTVLTRTSDFAVVADSVESEMPAPSVRRTPVVEAPVVEASAAPIEAPKPEPVAPSHAPSRSNGLTDHELEQLLAPEPYVAEEQSEPSPEEESADRPVRRTRSAPEVSVEDFGSIVRAKMPAKPLSETAQPVARATPRARTRVDTSGIDS